MSGAMTGSSSSGSNWRYAMSLYAAYRCGGRYGERSNTPVALQRDSDLPVCADKDRAQLRKPSSNTCDGDGVAKVAGGQITSLNCVAHLAPANSSETRKRAKDSTSSGFSPAIVANRRATSSPAG